MLSRRPVITLIVTLATALRVAAAEPSAGAMSAALQPFVDRHALAGAVTLVSNKDRVLDVETVGYADIAAARPMQKDELFWIASMTKPMTAAALMMLVDEGKVNLADPVEKYLPDYKGQRVIAEKDDEHAVLRNQTHPITVRNVLSHTSGLPLFSRPEVVSGRIDGLPLSVAAISYA